MSTKYYCPVSKTTLKRVRFLDEGRYRMKLQTDKKSSRYTTLVCRYLVQQNKIDWITKLIDFN